MTLVPPNSNRGGYPLALAGATAATRYVGATASGAPVAGTFAVGDFIIDQSGKAYVCSVAGSPGTWVAVGGSGGGSLVEIDTQVLGADAAGITFSGIAGTYGHLLLFWTARGTNAGNPNLNLRFNADAGANYDQNFGGAINNAFSASALAAQTSIGVMGALPGSGAAAGFAASGTIFIPAYSSTVFHKSALGLNVDIRGAAATDFLTLFTSGTWRNTAAITTVALLASADNLLTGSQASLYGLTNSA